LSKTEISVRVHPNAASNEVVGVSDGVWQVRVSAPPVKGKANKELIAFLSQLLRVSKGRISIIRGHTSRNKTIAISGLSQEDIVQRLFPFAETPVDNAEYSPPNGAED
jgi:uncharacterized protein (TIGR00251 family)